MLEPLTGLPDGVVGFTIAGELDADDYEKVLAPAVEAQVELGRKVRIVLVIPEWDGITAGGTWQDLKMGTKHLTHWERTALVTDVEWMVKLTHALGWLTPGDLKHFPLAERDAAVAWASGD